MCMHIFEERERLIIYNSVQDGSSLAGHQIQSPKIVAAMFKVNVAYRKKIYLTVVAINDVQLISN